MHIALDINEEYLSVGDTVEIPDPTGRDLWNHSFQATIEEILEDLDDSIYLRVVDGDGDWWEIDANRVTLID